MTKNRYPPPDLAHISSASVTLGARLPDGGAQKLEKYLSELVAWNQRLDLTAARSTDELSDLMLADAFVLASRVPQGVTVVDVGTGAGAPGLALAVARPDLRVTLVEPLAKRVAFLRTVLAAIGREDVGLLRMKIEELRTRFDVAIARATFPPAEWLERSANIVTSGGSTWVLLAKESPPEPPAELRAERVEDVTYTWPATGASRRAARYRFQ